MSEIGKRRLAEARASGRYRERVCPDNEIRTVYTDEDGDSFFIQDGEFCYANES